MNDHGNYLLYQGESHILYDNMNSSGSIHMTFRISMLN